MAIDIASDEIWQDVAEYIWAQVGVSLALKSCEQGNYLNLPTRDDLSAILPLVLVEAQDAEGRSLPGHSGQECAHQVHIHYVVKLSDTDISDRKTRQGRDAIANLFTQTPFDGGTALPGVTLPARCNVFRKSLVGLRILETFTEMELAIGHGVVDLEVVLHHYNT